MDRSTAIAWAKQLLDRTDWCILDTETTCFKEAQICEIGILDCTGHPLLDSRCRPTVPISPGASAVNGIFDSDVVNAPSFPEIFPLIQNAIAGREVVIYNAVFDRRVIEKECQRNHFPSLLNGLRISCAMNAYTQYCGSKQKLPAASHNAIGDCLAVLDLIRMIATNDDKTAFSTNMGILKRAK